MRILHLVSYSLYSGPVPQTLALARAQQQLGHTVWLAIDRKRGNINGYEEAAAPHLDKTNLPPPLPLTLSAKSSLRQNVKDTLALRQLCKSGAVDVVHVHLSHDHILAALAAVPTLIRTVHAARSLRARLGQAHLLRQAHGWIVRCKLHRDSLLYRFGAPSKDVAVIAGSVDTSRFTTPTESQRTAARALWDIPGGAPVLGHVALMAGRGQEELLDAASRMGSLAPFLLFVGRGEDEEALRRRVDALGLKARVRFTGYLEGLALRDAYAAMDAAFVAQPGNDASARAALEAMACGLPVVALQEAALAEVVTEEVGYPFASRAVDHIAAALARWLADPQTAQTRGQRARQSMEQNRQVLSEAAATLRFYEACAGQAP